MRCIGTPVDRVDSVDKLPLGRVRCCPHNTRRLVAARFLKALLPRFGLALEEPVAGDLPDVAEIAHDVAQLLPESHSPLGQVWRRCDQILVLDDLEGGGEQQRRDRFAAADTSLRYVLTTYAQRGVRQLFLADVCRSIAQYIGDDFIGF